MPGRVYRIEYTDDLEDWDYASAELRVAAEETEFKWIDDGSTTGGLPRLEKRRFYRVEISMP